MWNGLLDYANYIGDNQYNGDVQQAMLAQIGPEKNFMVPDQTKSEVHEQLMHFSRCKDFKEPQQQHLGSLSRKTSLICKLLAGTTIVMADFDGKSSLLTTATTTKMPSLQACPFSWRPACGRVYFQRMSSHVHSMHSWLNFDCENFVVRSVAAMWSLVQTAYAPTFSYDGQ